MGLRMHGVQLFIPMRGCEVKIQIDAKTTRELFIPMRGCERYTRRMGAAYVEVIYPHEGL